ncbi:hypothetical protein TN98_18840 [Pantoea anthophila]|nr:hypothetical protein TN98_18840 [Pantoea anthophila]
MSAIKFYYVIYDVRLLRLYDWRGAARRGAVRVITDKAGTFLFQKNPQRINRTGSALRKTGILSL